jgi:prevent-host-death family protein
VCPLCAPVWSILGGAVRSTRSSASSQLRFQGVGTQVAFFFERTGLSAILVRTTRLTKSKLSASKGSKGRPLKGRSGYWLLQDAKARFSELVRKVRSEGPQHVTVHGRDEVVVIAAEEFRRLKGSATGQALIEAMQASPHRDIEIAPRRGTMPVRDVSL